ncbi:energy transducer TonB, partial [Emticicia sp. CRIBPO]|nr:energy transducer TonB [Emticicia sp. CRIBPO]
MANEQQKVTLDDIVFENRNKEYGAYFLRKNYARFLNRAVFIGVGVFTLVFGGAWTYQKYIIPNLPAEEKSVDIVLDDLPPKKEDEPLNVPPPPP